MTTINYNYVAMPVQLTMILDNNLRSMLFTLIQVSSFYADENGYFFRTIEDLRAESNLSQNLVRATLDTLYKEGLVDIKSVGAAKGKKPNFYKVNYEKFAEYDKISIEDCLKNPLYKLYTADYKNNFVPSYLQCNNECKEQCKEECKKVSTNIDNIENKDNISNIENINNIDNNTNKDIKENIEIEEEVNLITKDEYNNLLLEVLENSDLYAEQKKDLMDYQFYSSSTLNFFEDADTYKSFKEYFKYLAEGGKNKIFDAIQDFSKEEVEDILKYCVLNFNSSDNQEDLEDIPTVNTNVPTAAKTNNAATAITNNKVIEEPELPNDAFGRMVKDAVNDKENPFVICWSDYIPTRNATRHNQILKNGFDFAYDFYQFTKNSDSELDFGKIGQMSEWFENAVAPQLAFIS